jgi:hypothetical protein
MEPHHFYDAPVSASAPVRSTHEAPAPTQILFLIKPQLAKLGHTVYRIDAMALARENYAASCGSDFGVALI